MINKRTIFILGMTICILFLIGRSIVSAQDLNVQYIGDSYNPNNAPVNTLIVFDYIPQIQPNTTNLDLIEVKTVSYKNFDLSGYSSSWGGFHKDIIIDGKNGFS